MEFLKPFFTRTDDRKKEGEATNELNHIKSSRMFSLFLKNIIM